MANKLVWGNPNTQSFKKQQLRWAYYDDHKVQVHRHVWPIVERLFVGMGQMGIDVTQASEVTSEVREGFRLEHQPDDFLQSQLEAVHFVYNSDTNEYLYVGSIEDAVAITKAIAAEPKPDIIEDEDEPVGDSDNREEPWTGDMADAGFNQFMSYVLGNESVGYYQARNGLVVTDEVDYATLMSLMPTRPMWFRPGHTGHYIKVLQAAFITRGYLSTPVTGVWGIEFSRALRKFQADYSIHPRLRIGTAEWSALFDFTQPVDDAPIE